MHPRTAATLEQLKEPRWFRNVGQEDVGGTPVVIVRSWAEAAESCGSNDWQNLCIEAANQLRARIQERSPGRRAMWNALVDELRPVSQGLVREKLADAFGDREPPPAVRAMADWDALHVLMESEFADVVAPGFYASQGYWYVAGRFPCGWHGDFPQG